MSTMSTLESGESEQFLDSNQLQNNDEEKIEKEVKISKNQIKKQRRYQKILFRREIGKEKRKQKRKLKERQMSNNQLIKKEGKPELLEKIRSGEIKAPKVVIDCHYDNEMSEKERKGLAKQLQVTYAKNRKAANPLHLYFACIDKSGEFFKSCCITSPGFEKFILNITSEPVLDLFPPEKLVYLSPDSSNVLESFDPEKVYVLGGIVDDTVSKFLSLNYCAEKSITTARLPIDEYFKRSNYGTYKKIMSINQIVDIILEWYNSKDWVKAIQAGLPQRTGYVPRDKPLIDSNELIDSDDKEKPEDNCYNEKPSISMLTAESININTEEAPNDQ